LEFACLDIIGQKRNVPVYEILGGKFEYQNGKIKVPDKSGLGIKLNRDKLAEYAELYKRLGGYPYDQDPLRQGSSPIVPNNRRANELDARTPEIAF
jgi:glucarate dehydratase